MSRQLDLKLRTSVILLLAGTVLATLAVVGSTILAVAIDRINADNERHVRRSATELASRVESVLADIEARVFLTGSLYQRLPAAGLHNVLDQALQPTLSAIYVIDADGTVAAVSIAGASIARTRELVGIDLSSYPLFRGIQDSRAPLWTDKHISAVTGTVTLGLAAPIGGDGSVIVAELLQETLLGITQLSREDGHPDLWIIDRNGEVVTDTDPGPSDRVNLNHLPIVAAGLDAGQQPDRMQYGDTDFHVSAAYSQKLGWLFVGRIPAGLENPRVQEIITIVALFFGGSVAVGLILAPVWAQGVVGPIRAVADRAKAIAAGNRPAPWPRATITELNHLAADLDRMAKAIIEREADLQQLNEELEDRVARRTDELTRSNAELSNALQAIEQAKDELIRSEKLAALGRLVAGLAHELNTPLGNGRLAVSSMSDVLDQFDEALARGLRRSDMDSFVAGLRKSAEITERNLVRAGELVRNFKQVAADRTTARRREFSLKEILEEVRVTLSPTLDRSPIGLEISAPDDFELDSYPGALGQVITNLIENSLLHGFRHATGGTITITVSAGDVGDQVRLAVCDNGAGMPAEVARQAFDHSTPPHTVRAVPDLGCSSRTTW